MKKIVLIFLFLTIIGCKTTSNTITNSNLTVKNLPEETIEKKDKANIYFVRPMKMKFLLNNANIFLDNTFLGTLENNSLVKVFIEEGAYDIIAAPHLEGVFDLKNKISFKFEKGKNYYFLIDPKWTKLMPSFAPKLISRVEYIKLSEKVKADPEFGVNVRKGLGDIYGAVIKEAENKKTEKKEKERQNNEAQESIKNQDKAGNSNKIIMCKLNRSLSQGWINSGRGYCVYNCEDGTSMKKLGLKAQQSPTRTIYSCQETRKKTFGIGIFN